LLQASVEVGVPVFDGSLEALQLMVMASGHVMLGGGIGATVKVALQVTLFEQLLMPVNTTVFVPPHSDGAPFALFATIGVQPPVIVAVASQLVNNASTSACDLQVFKVKLVGHVNTSGGGADTVNEAVHVFGGSQALVTVNVTVLASPQEEGGFGELLLLNVTLHPPETTTDDSHATYLFEISVCD
jgi:hypothetical protein